jgi:hypothetical protein
MSVPTTESDHVISEAELDALERELGLVGMVLYLQRISPGKGDYTAERQQPDSVAYEEFREMRAKSVANGRSSHAMNSTASVEEEKILRAGYSALFRELGPVGMIRFIQRISRGKSDYTAKRQQPTPLNCEEMLASVRAENGDGNPNDERGS